MLDVCTGAVDNSSPWRGSDRLLRHVVSDLLQVRNRKCGPIRIVMPCRCGQIDHEWRIGSAAGAILRTAVLLLPMRILMFSVRRTA